MERNHDIHLHRQYRNVKIQRKGQTTYVVEYSDSEPDDISSMLCSITPLYNGCDDL